MTTNNTPSSVTNSSSDSTPEFTQFVGVDIAKDHLDVFIPAENQLHRIENSKAAIDKFLRRFKQAERARILVVMEATGGYEYLLTKRLHAAGIAWAAVNPLRIRQFYSKQLKSIDARIAEAIKDDAEAARKAELLTSVPGVGTVTATVMISQMPELGKLNRGQIAKLAGVAPIANDSGKKTGYRKTMAGRSSVRKTLYMAALVATRSNPVIERFYKSLLKNGKPKKLALVACMRKLLTILNCMVRNNQHWKSTVTA